MPYNQLWDQFRSSFEVFIYFKKYFFKSVASYFLSSPWCEQTKKKIRNYIQHHNFHIAELKSVWILLSIKLKAFVFSETIVTQKKSMLRFVTV